MKRLVTSGIIAMLLVAVIACVSGCGGDTKQAQQYMKAGDAQMAQVETKANELSAQVGAAFTDITSPAAFSAAVAKVKSLADEITAEAQKAKAEYEKIKPLKGVPDYKKYAALQILIVDTEEELMKRMNAFLDQSAAIVSSGTGSTEQLTALQQSFQADIDKLTNAIGKAEEQANKLKSDKNL
jgi:hypothetical protein